MSLLADGELKLYHCKVHDEWYSQNCSNCMIASNEPDIIAQTLRVMAEWWLAHCDKHKHSLTRRHPRMNCRECRYEYWDWVIGEGDSHCEGKAPWEEKDAVHTTRKTPRTIPPD